MLFSTLLLSTNVKALPIQEDHHAIPAINVRDLQGLQRVSGSQVSPDGQFAVYSVKQWDSKTGKSTSNIDIVHITSGEVRRLTNKFGVSDYSPKFTPDSQFVMFLSSGRGSTNGLQIYSVPVKGSESQISLVSNYDVPVESFKVSKSLKGNLFYIAFSAQVYLSCNDRPTLLSCSKKMNDDWESKGSNTGYVYDKLFVRHWDTYIIEGKVSHVFLQKIVIGSDSLKLVAEPFDTMFGMNANCPIGPFGGDEQYDISTTGAYIALNIEINDHAVSWSTGWKIFVTTVNNWYSDVNSPITANALKSITSFTSARTQNPLFSPFQDELLSYLAMNTPGYESDNLHLNLYNILTDRTNDTVFNFDRSISEHIWLDSKRVVISCSNDAIHSLYLVDLSSGIRRTLTAEGHSAALQVVIPGESIVYSLDSFVAPVDLYYMKITNVDLPLSRKLTNYNHEFLAKYPLVVPRKDYFIGAKGEKVQAWIFTPLNFDPRKKYPTVNIIHGGPESAIEDAWSYRWNPQLFVSQGYAAIIINFHGSEGFGLDFKKSILGNWGSYPYEDITNGTDILASRYSFIDASRICALGASYGGFSINWLLGHNENGRYKCFVTHDGLSELVSAYYSTDELWFPEMEFQGAEFSHPENYQKFNPINYVTKWKTPTLVIHGGKDFRLPIAQGLTVFTALQRQGVPSKMIVFPEENHWVLKPQNSILWYDTVLDWIGRWIGN
ncbi:hypothetical protein FDP41_005254 [Naegleria fowleri]|uniref:Peptidase S9 prolyl oligopeptidase catalytic domain-containing protein n=1 Tax=Naegleria fowleri TaxID=5763 RepID=A0A6A5BG15_NAEFO|nr:uncharacterized protein FDP41_005254 [Naegleria fowleri]KAF0975927.1 hypothetical protein FDP41_005254 [Naegleria fowleri]